MPRIDPIQQSFAGGEITPRLRGRVGTDLYKSGLATLINFEPTPQGSLLKRVGSAFARSMTDELGGYEAAVARLASLPLAGHHGYLVGLGRDEPNETDTLTVWSADGLIENAGKVITDHLAERVTNGRDFASGWDYGGTYTVVPSSGLAKMGIPEAVDPVACYLEQELTLVGTGARTHRLFFSVPWMSNKTTLTVTIADADADPGADPLFSFSKSWGASPTWSATETRFAFDVEIPAGCTAVVLRFETANDGAGTLSEQHIDIDNVSFHSPTGTWHHSAPWTAEQIPDVCIVPEPGSIPACVLLHPDVAPYRLALQEGEWTLAAASFTEQPDDWFEGNWPAVGDCFQGRLWLGNTRNKPGTFWASVAGSLFDFTIPEEATEASAFSFGLGTKGEIRWMRGQKAMLLGTDVGEHAITSQSGVISALDIALSDESPHGSCGSVRPLPMGVEVLYPSRDGRKVRAINYAERSGSWESREMSFIGEHLVTSIAALEVATDPSNVFAVLTDDGYLRLCTVEPESGVTAWWRHTNGLVGATVDTITVTNGPEGSCLWTGIDRGTSFKSLEYQRFGDPTDAVYLDGWVRAYFVSGALAAGTLSHIASAAVHALIGGELKTGTVGSNGSLTIAGSTFTGYGYVGLPFQAYAKTLPLQQLGAERRRSRVYVRVYDSALPTLNGEAPVLQGDTAAADDGNTGDARAGELGFGDQGAVEIAQLYPYRTEILALFGSAEADKV